MQLRALSIGEAVPRDDFETRIQSTFDTTVNLRLLDEDRIITMLVSEDYELPQGIRIWPKSLSLQTLTPGSYAAARGGILRFNSSFLSVDLRNTPVWKCHIPDLNLDMHSPASRKAWLTAWKMLDREKQLRSVEIHADKHLQRGAGVLFRQHVTPLITSLITSTEELDIQAASRAADKLIGLGPGVTPSGDDILIGFLAGLWSTRGHNQEQLAFIHSFGKRLIQSARKTCEISRTYIFHAVRGQFSKSLSLIAEAIANAEGVEQAMVTAMRVGHFSGQDSVTGLLTGVCIWNEISPFVAN